MTKDELELRVVVAQRDLTSATAALQTFLALSENNQFTDLDDAIGVVEEKLTQQAYDDCQGAYNCGNEEYTQDFMVSGVLYRGKLTCEYNRHDKTYYYVEESEFTYEAI